MSALGADAREELPMGDDDASRATHSAACSILRTGLATLLAAIACVMTSPMPLGAAEAKGPCERLNEWLAVTGTNAQNPVVFDRLAKVPSPFRAELSTQWLPGDGVASVTFEDSRIAAIADADDGKICVKAYANTKGGESIPAVTIQQVFLEKAKDGQPKRLKVVFAVERPRGLLYNRVGYLFVGVLPDATPPFSYFVRATVVNNWTAAVVSGTPKSRGATRLIRTS
jgi:hypothetical protein